MNILIDLTSLSYHITGIERYALCISEELLKMDATNHYILVFREEVYSLLKQYVDNDRVTAHVLHGNNKKVFELFIKPKELRKISADCYLFFAGRSPILFRKKKIYNTIHDLVCWDYPKTQRLLQMFYSRLANRNAAKVSEKIFTVSNFSKSRIHELLRVENDKIVVTYNGISNSFDASREKLYKDIKEKYKLPDKYILNLSTVEPRKNLFFLLKCFDSIANQVDYDLVLVGRKGWKTEKLLSVIKTNERVHLTGFVEDDEVVEIYKHAMCFVFPSLYEGFGIPPIEALSMGTPVISSDSSCLKEILRNQAVFFKNNDAEDLKKLLINLPTILKSMPKQLDNYQKEHFSFKRSAQIILSAITH